MMPDDLMCSVDGVAALCTDVSRLADVVPSSFVAWSGEFVAYWFDYSAPLLFAWAAVTVLGISILAGAALVGAFR